MGKRKDNGQVDVTNDLAIATAGMVTTDVTKQAEQVDPVQADLTKPDGTTTAGETEQDKGTAVQPENGSVIVVQFGAEQAGAATDIDPAVDPTALFGQFSDMPAVGEAVVIKASAGAAEPADAEAASAAKPVLAHSEPVQQPYGGDGDEDDEPVGSDEPDDASPKASGADNSDISVMKLELTGVLKNLTGHSTAKTLEQVRSTIEGINSKGALMECGSVLIYRLTTAGICVYSINAGHTEQQRQETFVEDIKKLKLSVSKSKSNSANAVVAALGLQTKAAKESERKTVSENRRRIDRDGLCVDATVRVLSKMGRDGLLDLNDGVAVLDAALGYIEDQGGVVKVSNAERKRNRELDQDLIDDSDGKDIVAIPLDEELYADHRKDMVKATLRNEAGADLNFTVGLGIMEDGKAVDFRPVKLKPAVLKTLMDDLISPPAAVEFLAQVVVCGRALAEVKTSELRNKADNPKDPDAERIVTHRVLIMRPNGQIVVTARNRDAGVLLLATPAEPLFKEPVHGDLIMVRSGYQHLAVNLVDPTRRPAFTFKGGANRKDRDGKSPIVTVLATKVAQTEGTNYASCVAAFRIADRSNIRDIRIADEALVKPKVTATVNASVFADAAERLPKLSGKKADKKAGNRVTIGAKDDALLLTTEAGKVVMGSTTSGAGTGEVTAHVHRDDLDRVLEAIASQALTGPVTVMIDPTGVVKFDFRTMVGQFSFLIPTLTKDGRNARHFLPFTPTPWTKPATDKAA